MDHLSPRDTTTKQNKLLINNTLCRPSPSIHLQLRSKRLNAVDANEIEARQHAATKYFKQTLEKYGAEEIQVRLNEAIPEGADIGEMMMHTSDELRPSASFLHVSRTQPYYICLYWMSRRKGRKHNLLSAEW